jgi:hypothetical protein
MLLDHYSRMFAMDSPFHHHLTLPAQVPGAVLFYFLAGSNRNRFNAGGQLSVLLAYLLLQYVVTPPYMIRVHTLITIACLRRFFQSVRIEEWQPLLHALLIWLFMLMEHFLEDGMPWAYGARAFFYGCLGHLTFNQQAPTAASSRGM